jgi:hypothetical protein
MLSEPFSSVTVVGAVMVRLPMEEDVSVQTAPWGALMDTLCIVPRVTVAHPPQATINKPNSVLRSIRSPKPEFFIE